MTTTAHLWHVLNDAFAAADQFGGLLPSPAPTTGNSGGGFQLPDVPPAPPPELTGYFSTFLGAIKWIAGAVAALSLGVIAIKMTLGKSNRHHLAADGAASVPWVFVGLMLAMTAVSVVGFVVPSGS
ncbi:hypothetical protein [Nonomuraea ceibae]|uniref:hypothetical protein n=1 Tax=Nonomuraea ceibae TaxID=1935170 RepID=UPI001C5F5F38|nr:hypothetical protein [Nonomuraea ceibae]